MNDGPYTCYKTEVFLTFIQIYSSTTNVVCASSTHCVLVQLPASSLLE